MNKRSLINLGLLSFAIEGLVSATSITNNLLFKDDNINLQLLRVLSYFVGIIFYFRSLNNYKLISVISSLIAIVTLLILLTNYEIYFMKLGMIIILSISHGVITYSIFMLSISKITDYVILLVASMIGTMILPLLIYILLIEIDWRLVYSILLILYAIPIVFNETEIVPVDNELEQQSLKNNQSLKVVVVLLVINFCCGISLHIPSIIIHQSLNINMIDGYYYLSYITAIEIISCLISTLIIKDHHSLFKATIMSCSIITVSYLLLLFNYSIFTTYLTSTLFSVGSGVMAISLNILPLFINNSTSITDEDPTQEVPFHMPLYYSIRGVGLLVMLLLSNYVLLNYIYLLGTVTSVVLITSYLILLQ